MSGDGIQASTAAVELGLQLKAERRRPRPGKPKGYAKTEVPKNICSDRTLLDIEEGRKRTVKRGFVRDICAFYQTDRILVENLVKLADATYMDDWTVAYTAVVDRDAWLYQQREDRASTLTFHDSTSLPSLIQPESYIDMIERTTKVTEDEPDYEQAKRFRAIRQRRWIESARRMTCLIGEAVFALDFGSGVNEDVQRSVLELARLPFADIRVIPFSAGRYDLIGWELSYLEFANAQEPVIRARSPRGAGFVPVASSKGKFFSGALHHARELSIPVRKYLS